MERIIFGSYIHDERYEAKEELGPFILKTKYEKLRTLIMSGKVFREFRDESESSKRVYLLNTKITPIPGTDEILITGDRVRYSEVPF